VNETIVVALIVSVIAPSIVSVLAGHQRRKEKDHDWERQDEVARRAAEVAEDLVIANEHVVAATQVIAENAAATHEKLEVIHGLVNSAMTAAMRAELDETKSSLVLMEEVLALHAQAGQAATPETRAAISEKKAKVVSLTAAFENRLAEAASHLP
jgi:hypothetical protein